MRQLKEIEPELYKKAVANMRNDIKPIISEARNMLPGAAPLTRWTVPKGGGVIDKRKRVRTSGGFPVYNATQAKRGVKAVATTKRKKGFTGRMAIIGVTEIDGAGVVFNSAGHKTNGVFVQNLTAKYGKGQRFMWPAFSKHKTEVRASVQHSIREMELVLNERLRVMP